MMVSPGQTARALSGAAPSLVIQPIFAQVDMDIFVRQALLQQGDAAFLAKGERVVMSSGDQT